MAKDSQLVDRMDFCRKKIKVAKKNLIALRVDDEMLSAITRRRALIAYDRGRLCTQAEAVRAMLADGADHGLISPTIDGVETYKSIGYLLGAWHRYLLGDAAVASFCEISDLAVTRKCNIRNPATIRPLETMDAIMLYGESMEAMCAIVDDLAVKYDCGRAKRPQNPIEDLARLWSMARDCGIVHAHDCDEAAPMIDPLGVYMSSLDQKREYQAYVARWEQLNQ